MKTIELDLTGCKYLSEIHEKIQIAFDFPKWYGKNWDAFWDLIRSECDADKVIVKGELSLPQELHPQLATMHEVLNDKIGFNQKCNFNPFSYEIVD